eukprot:SAG11_NODE_3048_length_2733_cov_1.307897_1_plen_197_part_00
MQDQFTRFCEEMGLVNEEMSRRLFLAMDDDNTGAMEAHEFLHGIRLMCDESGGQTWLTKRIEFAFNLFDLDREQTVDQSEIKSFLKTFYSVAKGLVEGWIEQFERMFGAEVAVLPAGGRGGRIRWREEPSLMRTMKSLEDKMEREREMMSEAAMMFRVSKEESGIRLAGFMKWCQTENESVKLKIIDWSVRLELLN